MNASRLRRSSHGDDRAAAVATDVWRAFPSQAPVSFSAAGASLWTLEPPLRRPVWRVKGQDAHAASRPTDSGVCYLAAKHTRNSDRRRFNSMDRSRSAMHARTGATSSRISNGFRNVANTYGLMAFVMTSFDAADMTITNLPASREPEAWPVRRSRSRRASSGPARPRRVLRQRDFSFERIPTTARRVNVVLSPLRMAVTRRRMAASSSVTRIRFGAMTATSTPFARTSGTVNENVLPAPAVLRP